MPVIVPPREFAATITAQAVVRTGWTLAIGQLLLCALVLGDLTLTGVLPGGSIVPFVALGVLAAGIVMLLRTSNALRGVVYLSLGTVAAFVFCYSLLEVAPQLNESGTFLLSRVGIVLMLVGPVSSRLIDGVWWCISGHLLGLAALASAQFAHGLEFQPGWGSTVSLAIYVLMIMTIAFVRRSQRRYVPNFSEIERETAKMAGQRELEEHTVALIHDTVLNDLHALANGPDNLGELERARLVRDIQTMTDAAAPTALLESDSRSEAEREFGGEFRTQLLAVISEYRWRGLSVDVSGGDGLPVAFSDSTSTALIGALAACLDNVLQHSGRTTAQVVVERAGESLTVMVVDEGDGFDPAAVSADRLGLRSAVVNRIESCGGSVRIWSGVGEGTSIVMTVPMGADDA